MAHLVPKALADQGMTGWTSMPVLGSPMWLTLITTIVMGVGIGVLTRLAAAMSTLSALYHAMGTALVCDFWDQGKECALSMRAHQYGIVG